MIAVVVQQSWVKYLGLHGRSQPLAGPELVKAEVRLAMLGMFVTESSVTPIGGLSTYSLATTT